VTINIAFLDHAFHHGSLPRSFTAGLRAVVGVDGSGRSLRALIWAAHEAALWRCSLRIVHVLPRWEFDIPLYPPGRWDEAEDRGRHIVAEAIAIARETYPDLDLTAALPSGAPASVFLDESEHAQVVALGARGEGRIGDLLVGSVSLQVAGHAASPVVVVDHITSGHRRSSSEPTGRRTPRPPWHMPSRKHRCATPSRRGCTPGVCRTRLNLPS
jgi:nucleotide-binding universal stress UspA family protein